MRGTVGWSGEGLTQGKGEKERRDERRERSEGQCNSLPNKKKPLSTIGLDAHEVSARKSVAVNNYTIINSYCAL